MSRVASPPKRSILLEHVSWQGYTDLSELFDERQGVRMTYDHGKLEIVRSLSFEHEDDASFLGRLVMILTEELDLPIRSGKSTTLRLQLRQSGLEPDECFWIANAAKMRGRRRIDLTRDPPPDLAIEVVVTHAVLDRLDVYAGLKVPEVWRLKKNTLRFYVLERGTYVETKHSRSFPMVTSADIMGFLHKSRDAANQNAVVREFRAWVQERREQS